MEECEKQGFDVKMVNEKELKKEDTVDQDLIVAMGGDHTFLVASSATKTSKIPILGINTYIGVQHGALHSNYIEYASRR